MADKPNILVFFTDDHGQWAASCYGNTELTTPSFDYLAETGARMDRGFTPSPVCSPARACFQTGRLPSTHGVHDWLSPKGPAAEHPAITGQIVVAELLQQSGYETAHVGKWHAGKMNIPQPGYDLWAATSQGPHHGEISFYDQGPEAVKRTGFHSELVTDRSLEFLRNRSSDKPFFLHVGYTDTHSAFANHSKRLVDHYRKASFKDIPEEKPRAPYWPVRAHDPESEEQFREWNAEYYAAAHAIDNEVGRIIDHLHCTGELENTLIVYTSDHGHMNGHHGLWCKGNATSPQNFYDESILVPLLVSWPAKIKPGQVNEELVDHCDLFWTVLDAAGAEVDERTRKRIQSPGSSYLPLLTGESDQWRDAFFGEYGNARCIRTKTHKLVVRYPGPNGHFPDELYDLQADPREENDLIGDPRYADVQAALRSRLETHFEKYEDPELSGANIESQHICNAGEPWRAEIPWMKNEA